ncbi:MAG: FHA domain-containing protein [Planctomycetaceae bacterium]|nr:FHA domain-containing protein [Planctomycetaceae bacterium]
MTNESDKTEMASTEIEEVTSQFFDNCGGDPKFQLSCLNIETKELEFFPLEQPYVLLGRAKKCEINLQQGEIGYRHVYLQLLNHRLLVVDLGTRSGTLWDGTPRRSGWLLPGREIQIGNYRIRLVKWKNSAQAAKDHSEGTDSDVTMESVLKTDSESFPHASLELLDARDHSPTGRILVLKPGVTLIGRSRVAQLRLKHESVSHVHSSLVLTQGGLWVVDLLGRDGTLINGEPIKYSRLQAGDHVQVGQFHLRVETEMMKLHTDIIQIPWSEQDLDGSLRQYEDSGIYPSDSTIIQKGNRETPEEFAQPATQQPVTQPQPPVPSEQPVAATEKPENENDEEASVIQDGEDTSRWAEIIEALKSGGFGE